MFYLGNNLWLPTDEVAKTDEEVRTLALMRGIYVNKFGAVWQIRRPDDGAYFDDLVAAITFLAYDPAQQLDKEGDE